MPLLSIIIPVYNSEKYLRDCLDSALAQDISDAEIICVNDGSTDRSLSILEKYRHKNKCISVITKQNRGLAAARNTGYDLSRGEFVTFLDSDDIVKKEMYAVLIGIMQDNGADTALCGYELLSDSSRNSFPRFTANTVLSPIEFLKSNNQLFESNDLCFTWRYVFRRSVLDSNTIRAVDSLRSFQDAPFNLAAVLASRKVISIPESYYRYRNTNADSITRRAFNPYREGCFDISFTERDRLASKYHLDDYMPFTRDMSEYIVKRMIPLLLDNAYANPDETDKVSATRRVLSLPSVRRATETIGFGNIFPTAKEYVSYLFIKLGLYRWVCRIYNK